MAFNKTEIIIKLAQFEEETLISREQAKRITLNLEKFDRVVLDFKGIEFVGQGFVDQLFRVCATAHSKATLEYINANEDVEFMIRRGVATSKRQQLQDALIAGEKSGFAEDFLCTREQPPQQDREDTFK